MRQSPYARRKSWIGCVVAREVLRFRCVDLPRDGSGDLARDGRVFLLDTVRAVVARAAFDGRHGGVGDELKHVARFESQVLHAQMARHLIADLAEARGEVRFEQPLTVPQHQVFERVEKSLRHTFDALVVGKQKRQLLLEHQHA
jgi:hypothetical protein